MVEHCEGVSVTSGREVVVSLATILTILEERNREIDQLLVELEANRPDLLSSAADKTSHAGRVGEAAGRRNELAELASRLAGIAQDAILFVPPQDEIKT